MRQFLLILMFVTLLIQSCKDNICNEKNIKKRIGYYNLLKAENDSNRISTIDSLFIDCGYQDVEMYADKASYYFAKSRWENAINAYSIALDLGYDKEIVYNNRAICYSKINQPELAWNDYNILKKYNTMGETGMQLLEYQIFNNTNEKEKALNIINTILIDHPNSAIYHYEKSNVLLSIGDTTGYCETINKAIKLGITKIVTKNESQLLRVCTESKKP